MSIEYLIKGMIIGFSASAPLGPIGILCVQKTINKGRISGYVSGLGAAMADIIYAIISGFGLTIISNFIIQQQLYLRICGGIVLLYLGIKIFLTNPGIQIRKQSKEKNFFSDFISIFLLTISNPITLFVFAGVFAGFGLVNADIDYKLVTELVFGVFLGAAIWWIILVTLIDMFRSRIRLRRLLWINKTSGVIIVLFGIAAIISLFYMS